MRHLTTPLYLICTLLFIAACSSPLQQHSAVMNTVQVGLLEKTNIATLNSLSADSQWQQTAQIQQLSKDELLNNMQLGNLDIAIGLPQQDTYDTQFVHSGLVFTQQKFDYWVLRDDAKRLHRYVFFNHFSEHIKQIGYLHTPQMEVLKDSLLPDLALQQSYLSCYQIRQCLTWLQQGKIDTIYASGSQLSQHQSANVVNAGFEQTFNFPVYFNHKTLTPSEQQLIKRWLSLSY